MIGTSTSPSPRQLRSIERFFRAAKSAGCPKDQIKNFLDARLVLRPKQLQACAAARECDKPDGPMWVAYGGARGGGKSHWGFSQVIADDLVRFPGLKFLYLRKVLHAGREAIEDLRRETLHHVKHTYRAQEGRIILPNSSSMILGHFQSEKDIDNYLGLQYDGVLIEEINQLSKSKVDAINGSIRTSKVGWRPRRYVTFNPGGIGHGFTKTKFYKPWKAKRETDSRFVRATVRDNPFVDPDYRRNLESLEGWMRQAWLLGNMDLAQGQYFLNWRDADQPDPHVRHLASLPADWGVWLSLDHGYRHYTTCYLMADDNDGNRWVVDEHAEREWTPELHAPAIRQMIGRWGVEVADLQALLAGGDIFSTERDGKCVADDYESLGLKFTRANMDRASGAAEITRRLGNPDPEHHRPPSLFVNDRCHRLIDQIPAMVHDPANAEKVLKVDCDELGHGGDDAFDGLRYGVMYKVGKPARWGGDPFGR